MRVSLAAAILGWAGLAAQETTQETEPVLRLPDFLVRAINPEFQEREWHYGALPDFEVVSDRPEGEIREYLEELRRQSRLLDYWLPADLRSRPQPPYRIVLSRDAVPEAAPRARPKNYAYGGEPANGSWNGALVHLRHGTGEIHFSPEHDEMRAHPASRWTNYEKDRAEDLANKAYDAAWSALWRDRARQAPWMRWVFVGAGIASGVEAESIRVAGARDSRRDRAHLKLDLHAVFARHSERQDRGGEEEAEVFHETARWFGVWAFYGEGGVHRAALWRLSRAAARPSADTAALFAEYFGLPVAEAEARMEKLRARLRPPRDEERVPDWLTVEFPAKLPELEFRIATETDKGRLIGEWCWRATKRWPKTADKLREAGLRVVQRAARVERLDARLVAWQGLLELSAGETDRARSLLEQAVARGANDPLFTYELAKLRLAEAKDQAPEAGGKLDAAQTARVVDLLRVAWRRCPEYPGIFELALSVWLAAAGKPSREDLQEFAAAVAQFPREPKLIANSALLCLRAEAWKEADTLIEAGTQAAVDEAGRAAFAKLRTTALAAQKLSDDRR